MKTILKDDFHTNPYYHIKLLVTNDFVFLSILVKNKNTERYFIVCMCCKK